MNEPTAREKGSTALRMSMDGAAFLRGKADEDERAFGSSRILWKAHGPRAERPISALCQEG
jgi:hypothetical protein